jgi:hypothetical protein
MTLDQAMEEYDILDQIEGMLKEKGIVQPDKPKTRGKYYDGTIPDNMLDLDAFELGEILSNVTRWVDYIAGCYSWIEAGELISKERMESVRAFLRKRLVEERQEEKERGTATSAEDKKYKDDDDVRTNPQFVVENREYVRFKCLKIIAKRAYEAAESNRRAVSNAIKLVEESNKRGGREAGVKARRGGGGFRPRKSDG